MDNLTDHDQTGRSTDPARFANTLHHSSSVPRSAGSLVGSVLALLALVIGLPAALLVLSGPPRLPSGAPSLRDLAQQLSIEDLLSVLVAIVWLAWAYFLVCVCVEVVAARRGGLARPVPLAGPLQKLAQVLVGALLLSGLMATSAQAAVDVGSTAMSVSATPTAASGGSARGSVADSEASDQGTDAMAAVAHQENQVGKKIYLVTAPKDGYHDNLWDIAVQHLGDGLRYKEIYELNKDHLQPDGRKLELARLIQPGWHLIMPDDATGIAAVQVPAAPSADPGVPDATADSHKSSVAAHAPVQAGAEAAHSDSTGTWMAGAGLLAAGVVGALALQRRRQLGRRPDDDALDVECDFRIAATHARLLWVDQALRRLSRQCRENGVMPPSAYGAAVDDESFELLLSPAAPEAVEGWTAMDEGRRWRCDATHDMGAAEFGTVPYPAMVSLGVDAEGRDVLIDLEAAGGVVSIAGDPTVAAEVAAAIAVQVVLSPWATDARVITSDLWAGIGQLGDERISVVDNLTDDLDSFEAHIGGLRQDVLTGRMSRRGFEPSTVVVCGRAPEADVADRLGALAGSGRQAFSVVVAGEHRAARWRLHVDELGALSAPHLDLTVSANRIGLTQLEAVAELFAASREADPRDDAHRVRIPSPVRRDDDAAWATAARRVGVLGPVGVQGAADLPADRTDQVTELVTFLALHPEGVHPNVLASVVWPRGVTADVRDATIVRARGWLGTASDGTHNLRGDVEGRLSLAPEVICDWDCARNLFIAARKSSTPRDEADLLRRALGLVRGEAFSNVPQGRYGWIVRDDVTGTMTRVVVDGALRLCTLLDDDPAGAAKAAEAGLRIGPGTQELWRALMRARHDLNGVAGLRQTLDEMSDALRSIPLDAETEALVDELMPDTSSLATSG